jgi:hypothetical protein
MIGKIMISPEECALNHPNDWVSGGEYLMFDTCSLIFSVNPCVNGMGNSPCLERLRVEA